MRGSATFSTVYSETGPISSARSSRRSTSAARRWWEMSTVSSTPTRGCACAKALRNAGSQLWAMVSEAPTRNSPPIRAGSATRARISSCTNIICSA